MVMTHAPIPAAQAPLLTSIPYGTLTAGQLADVRDLLWELGIDTGHTANDGGNRDTATRLTRSAWTAHQIGLRLPAGEEIAECALCGVIAPSSSIREDEGLWRCTIPDPDGTTCYGIYLGCL